MMSPDIDLHSMDQRFEEEGRSCLRIHRRQECSCDPAGVKYRGSRKGIGCWELQKLRCTERDCTRHLDNVILVESYTHHNQSIAGEQHCYKRCHRPHGHMPEGHKDRDGMN